LRQIPLEWHPSADTGESAAREYPDFFAHATEVRDRAQVDNLDWILRREGGLGKILIYGHQYHLSATPVRTRWASYRSQEVFGTYLRRRLGGDFATIGNVIGGGHIGGGGYHQSLGESAPGALERLAGEIAAPLFLLDLRKAPPPVANWLDRERDIGEGIDSLRLSVGKAFDALLYIDRVTPAYRCAP
jgi:erythromycin esterase-like protein